jgi:hypothetical protein
MNNKTTEITVDMFGQIDAASDVLLDLEAITPEEWTRIRVALLLGAYGPDDAHLVRMALESYADAHA